MRTVLPALACTLALSGPALAAQAYPITLSNCGHTLTFAAAPARVVSIGQASTEILLSLGLAPRIVGTALWFGPLPPPIEDAAKGIPRLADNAPSFESVVGKAPELVTAQYTYNIGPSGDVATFEQFQGLGIPAYVSPSDCDGKAVTSTSNGDGARQVPFDMALIDREVTELARIFNVPAQGQAVLDAQHQRLAQAVARAQAGTQQASVAFWFSSARLEGDAWVAGNSGVPGYIARTLGLRNVIDSADEWPNVSWEQLAKQDPDYLVITRMDRRRYPADDVEKKLAFLRSDPVASQLKAVRNQHVIVVDAQSLNPSLRVTAALEAVAQGVGTP
ncbi:MULTISPECIES: ABC transporter substrate-binding protein [unclassified Pseudomonas]|uniref:ABC transporter substrate-binding protein n=1 Tax=unclassified Pseudomonas TaxID=196821 RepID=UPI000BD34984|nr:MULTISPECIES: ABC transporter substrate-binding protein [unclassified Pseudomonas]PVZ20038.1 iron complex transport system substrate-binding protein [Pseudomonas sp. URIL14HWK12:I12]PVZ27104.1 iron complex transport system substrate-binding protein [Pseudomonas sp. URIL14HWK12:I10]PVZ37993.1 iron complex transport system substrate-binding protein [Pseudomonas sp. URIL14HWK12:I11]SNZ04878.1 iron complex transport system substrate-binding protein [Pseudomonas sp. URIL14HWK12:I9]